MTRNGSCNIAPIGCSHVFDYAVRQFTRAEKVLEGRTHQLELANLAKSRFLAAASHDLRQPLHALGLLVGQLPGHMKSAEGGRLLDQIDAAVTSMNELFNALLDVSKLDAGVLSTNVTEFPIVQLFGRIERTFAEVARDKGLSFHVVSSSAWVSSDPILLERIVLNLVSNAVRYTTSGGVVVGCRRRGDTVHIEVCDSGPGIPDDQRRNIFGEFYRLPGGNSPGGLGLGIVDRLCNLLGHRVELNSRLGRGSRFSVTVPLAVQPQGGLQTQAASLAIADPARGKRVIPRSPTAKPGSRRLSECAGRWALPFRPSSLLATPRQSGCLMPVRTASTFCTSRCR
ncbi:MAG TPA: HAMP domain-containing sensor histidine kinase [Hyphomicrobiaceae bacterium]|nr:HAMP domain-containing sensor histidine kinase [Hyphomicrobiaceae bacterium]